MRAPTRKGDEIHYHRHDSTGALQTLAFIDSGKQLDIRDWNNPDSVNAALKVASQKWETLSVTGTNAYKETVARLAAEHGYTITNPEMQGRINERTEFAASRARVTQGQAQPGTKAAAESGAIGPERGEIEAAARGVTPTAAERELRLQDIRGRVEREAERETDEANRAKRTHETNAAQGTERTPFHSPTEAQSAREVERAVDNNVHREIPADPARQSQQMQTLRDQQSRVLQQEQEQRRVDQEKAERINRDLSQPRRPESQGQGR